jgi:aryl-alcohol dehydrogenase-like predicted oxidoreductase
MPQFTDEAIDANKELLELISNIANEKQATPAQISLAWMINKKPYIVPIPGSRKVSRIRENLEAGEIVLSKEEVEALDKKLDVIEMSAVFGGSPMK